MLKILSLAQEQIGDSPEKLQETAGWLLGQQLGDGSFHDPCPVIHRGMQVEHARGTARMSAVRWTHNSGLTALCLPLFLSPPLTRGAWWGPTRQWH